MPLKPVENRRVEGVQRFKETVYVESDGSSDDSGCIAMDTIQSVEKANPRNLLD